MTESKQDKIANAQSNLPLPEDPPVASDWNSANSKTVNVGSGDSKHADNPELRESGVERASGASDARVSGSANKTETSDLSNVGRQRVEGLSQPPADAAAGGKKNTQGVEATEKPDYGYPHKNDPSSGVDGPTRREV